MSIVPKNKHNPIRERVWEQIAKIKLEGQEPVKIHLTPADEKELEEAAPEIVTKVVYDKIREVGIRKAMKRFMGMKVFWDADETKVVGTRFQNNSPELERDREPVPPPPPRRKG